MMFDRSTSNRWLACASVVGVVGVAACGWTGPLQVDLKSVTVTCSADVGGPCEGIATTRVMKVLWSLSGCSASVLSSGQFPAIKNVLIDVGNDCSVTECTITIEQWTVPDFGVNPITQIQEGVYRVCAYVDRNDDAVVGNTGDFVGTSSLVVLNQATAKDATVTASISSFAPL